MARSAVSSVWLTMIRCSRAALATLVSCPRPVRLRPSRKAQPGKPGGGGTWNNATISALQRPLVPTPPSPIEQQQEAALPRPLATL